jgi:GTP-binding protein
MSSMRRGGGALMRAMASIATPRLVQPTAGAGGRFDRLVVVGTARPPPIARSRSFGTSPAVSSAAAEGAETKVRNFAIIAHVDHGKTTLLDTLMNQGGQQASERLMDNNDLEKERGITISSKYTSFPWRDCVFNAVDTPGHADFGGEVERVLDMVDGCLLLVDAQEGPMAQTKFVLSKALQKGLRPVVCLNKVDRPGVTESGCAEVESKLFDLFANMGATDDQLDFAVVYASAREGVASLDFAEATRLCAAPESQRSVAPLLDVLLARVPPPPGSARAAFKMLVSMIEHDAFVGRLVTGRVASGSVEVGDRVKAMRRGGDDASDGAGDRESGRVTKLFTSRGGAREPLRRASAGDIVSVAGLSLATVTDTVAAPEVAEPLPASPIDPPTLKMTFGVNDSKLGGREGKNLTGRVIWDRLVAEAETNVALRVLQQEGGGGDRFEVQGRGELHLGVLIETMRRENFELSVSPPAVLYKPDPDRPGKRLEPLEEVVAEVDEEHVGGVIEALSLRKGELIDMQHGAGEGGKTRLEFLCPSRGLIGFRSVFINETRGTGTMHRSFGGYGEFRGAMDRVRKGMIISSASGVTTTYALGQLEARGSMFVGPKVEVYEGMIIGESSRDESLEVNACKEKKLTNMRASGTDETVRLTPPRLMTLEEAIGYVQSDELIEVTPSAIRLRKAELDSGKRKAQSRKAAKA